jgi:small-conductance mechanosensitive channel
VLITNEFLGNPVRAWTIASLIAGAVFLALIGIRHFLGRRLKRIAERTATDVDDVAAELITKVRWYLIVALALRSGSIALTVSPSIERAIRQVTAIAVLLQLAVWGNALIGYWLKKWAARKGTDVVGASTLNAIGLVAKGLLWAIIGVLALRNVLDYDITALLTGLGIGGIAIALAVQNVLGDLFAALSIVLDRPFEVGDTIAVDTFTGTVEHIGLKTTRIRSVTGEQVIFSNGDLLKSRVRNLKRMRERRALVTLGVTYDTAPDQVSAIPAVLRGCVEAQPLARFDRAHFSRFADSWLEFELVYFVRDPDYLTFMDTQQAVNIAILRAFGERGIEFAFPTRMVLERRAAERQGVTEGG